jgi:hypothetical protein
MGELYPTLEGGMENRAGKAAQPFMINALKPFYREKTMEDRHRIADLQQ